MKILTILVIILGGIALLCVANIFPVSPMWKTILTIGYIVASGVLLVVR